jgi:hypothetical protein
MVARSVNTSITIGKATSGISPPARPVVAPRWIVTRPIPNGNSSASTRHRSNSTRTRSLNNSSNMKVRLVLQHFFVALLPIVTLFAFAQRLACFSFRFFNNYVVQDIASGTETRQARRRRRHHIRRHHIRRHRPLRTRAITALCRACAGKCPMVAPCCRTSRRPAVKATTWASNHCPKVCTNETRKEVGGQRAPWDGWNPAHKILCCRRRFLLRRHDPWHLHRLDLSNRIFVFLRLLSKVHFWHHVVQRSL